MHKLAELMKANRQRLVDIAIHETGAAMGAVNMANAAALESLRQLFEIYGTIEWEKAMLDKEVWGPVHRRLLVKELAGVVGAIIPLNVRSISRWAGDPCAAVSAVP
ncbi:aldehyde dehydrogenase family protein [Novosphingobium sp. G106]|uniref:aldehyde dehydrogenase family protein n=1 Tax=Novosphingobium sp. G106 TaxID=2849500 RepID=UPI0028124C6A|nr:aldehyde dehydrogenase family protein [Novosphingobium sp. G106]